MTLAKSVNRNKLPAIASNHQRCSLHRAQAKHSADVSCAGSCTARRNTEPDVAEATSIPINDHRMHLTRGKVSLIDMHRPGLCRIAVRSRIESTPSLRVELGDDSRGAHLGLFERHPPSPWCESDGIL